MTDIINTIARIAPGRSIDLVRDRRPQAKANAQLTFEALFEPVDPGTFTVEERLAVAVFVAALHAEDEAARFYEDLLGDVATDAVRNAVVDAANATRAVGPSGSYREPGLVDESEPTVAAALPTRTATVLGDRLSAGLLHAHLLVVHPRDARQRHLATLLEAGWRADDIVSLSQAVAFLTYQLRVAAGLRALTAGASETV